MADNVNITAGTGTAIHADEYTHSTLGSGKTQLVKLVNGALDSGTPILVDVGVKANALRVCPASDITDATYIGDIKFGEAEPNSAAIKTAVELLDNAVDGNYLNVNLNLAGADAVAGEGVITAATLRVSVATDDDLVAYLATIAGDTTSVDGKITACNTGAVVLAAGSAAIGKLAANSGVDIGDVDITSVPAPLNVVGAGTEAAALRVTIANDSTGVVSVDDGGGVITVDGTVTANLSAVDNAVLDNIDADTSAIQTAIEIMDDWDATHASASPSDGIMTMGAGYSAALPTDIGADADAARLCTDRYGRLLAGIMPQAFQATFNSADAQVAAPVKVKTASRKMYILSLVVSTDTAMNVQFQDDTGPTVLIENLYLAANGGAHLTWPPEAPLVVNTNEDFDIITSAAGNISVTITGYLAI